MADVTYHGRVFRQCSPRHAEVTSTTLEGSRREGGRFNPAGEFGALYASLERETSIRELHRLAERLRIPMQELLPRTILTLDVHLQRVLDLTDVGVCQAWGLSAEDLTSDDVGTCQEVGRSAWRAGYEAIRFPSATGTGTNLAVFLDRLHPAGLP